MTRDGKTIQLVGPGLFRVRIAVDENFRGAEDKTELTVNTSDQGSACGFPFEVGAQYVVYTGDNGQGGHLWTSSCSRTHRLKDFADDDDVAWMRSVSQAPHGARIFGSVALGRANAMRGATISLQGPIDAQAVTDDAGRYEFHALPVGEYKVTASIPTGFSVHYPDRKATVKDKGCAKVDWFAFYDAHVRGRVVDAEGNPMSRLSVALVKRAELTADPLASGATGMTREDGKYDIPGVEPGQYVLIVNKYGASPTRPYAKRYYPAGTMVEEALPINVNASASVDGIDVVMPPAWQKVSITARIINEDGTPAIGARVTGYEVANPSTGEPMSALTMSNGSVVLPVYEGQNYYITATVDVGFQQRCAGPVRFTAVNGQTVGTLRIEHHWGNCLAQLNPNFRPPKPSQ